MLATRSVWIGRQQNVFTCVNIQAEECSTAQYATPEVYRSKWRMHRLGLLDRNRIKSRHIRALGLPPVIHMPYLSLAWHQFLASRRWTSLVRFNTYNILIPREVLGILHNATVYDLWRRIVEQYSGRSFTHITEVFFAMFGLAEAFHAALGVTYLAGMWRGDLLHNLHWACETPDESTQSRFLQVHKLAGYIAPSWSWASVVSGDVQFRPLSAPRSSSLQCKHRVRASAKVLDAWTAMSTADTFGPLHSGALVLCTPFITIADPADKAATDMRVPMLHRYMSDFLARDGMPTVQGHLS